MKKLIKAVWRGLTTPMGRKLVVAHESVPQEVVKAFESSVKKINADDYFDEFGDVKITVHHAAEDRSRIVFQVHSNEVLSRDDDFASELQGLVRKELANAGWHFSSGHFDSNDLEPQSSAKLGVNEFKPLPKEIKQLEVPWSRLSAPYNHPWTWIVDRRNSESAKYR